MKFVKKSIVALLVFSMVMLYACYMPRDVQASVKVPKSVTGYLNTSLFLGDDSSGQVYIPVQGVKTYKDITNIKMTPNNFLLYASATSNNVVGCRIICESKKATSGTISYKIKGKSYKTKVTIKKYVNPAKVVNITGVKNGSSSNLASLTNKTHDSKEIKLSKTVKNPRVTVVARKGWKVKSIKYSGGDWGSKNYEKPVSKVTARIFTISKKMSGKSDYEVAIDFINTKNNAEIKVIYYINKDPRNLVPPNIETVK